MTQIATAPDGVGLMIFNVNGEGPGSVNLYVDGVRSTFSSMQEARDAARADYHARESAYREKAWAALSDEEKTGRADFRSFDYFAPPAIAWKTLP